MHVRQLSVRARLVAVITGLALMSSLAIGITFLGTEGERLDIQEDGQLISELRDLAEELSIAIRDQGSAAERYVLTANPDALARYRTTHDIELRVDERLALGVPDQYPGVVTALHALTQEADLWRRDSAEPAIAGRDTATPDGLDTTAMAVSTALEPTLARLEQLDASIAEAQDGLDARSDALTSTRAFAGLLGIGIMLAAAGLCLLLARRWISHPLDRLLETASEVESGRDVRFEAERDDEIGRLGDALERMRIALQGDVDRSTIMNRFTEVTTFAPDDAAVADANLEALGMLVRPDASVTHVLNRSKDRAIPEATRGPAIAEVLPLNQLSLCPAIVRGSIYVTTDAAQPLSVHCPVYPVDHGTLACIPLAHGEVVGAVHLAWERPDAFPLDLRSSVARIAEHAALAIANRRLLAALHGMANTDPRTGLANSRSLDQSLEELLAARGRDETLAVLMLDIDHFKDFNDRYGHPAGDVALRAFADVLRSCLRDGDIAARYGGEEFVAILPAVNEETALAIAERIRSRTESTLISLAPGITDRISVSIGVACAPDQASERVALLRLADDALYRAKQAGRNRVERASSASTDETGAVA
jgi:diguanylate cyclase (GGDEF)-like protein